MVSFVRVALVTEVPGGRPTILYCPAPLSLAAKSATGRQGGNGALAGDLQVGRAQVMPECILLIGMAHLQHRLFREGAPSYLEPYGQSLGVESAVDGQGRDAG